MGIPRDWILHHGKIRKKHVWNTGYDGSNDSDQQLVQDFCHQEEYCSLFWEKSSTHGGSVCMCCWFAPTTRFSNSLQCWSLSMNYIRKKCHIQTPKKALGPGKTLDLWWNHQNHGHPSTMLVIGSCTQIGFHNTSVQKSTSWHFLGQFTIL